MTVKGALQAMQELQASSGTQSGGSAERTNSTVNNHRDLSPAIIPSRFILSSINLTLGGGGGGCLWVI